VAEKYKRIGEKMNGSDMMILSTLDDIAWLTNLRGNDIDFNPVFVSYLIFFNKKGEDNYRVDLFLDQNKV
jgi:Xaa-Pro aminopeptidase